MKTLRRLALEILVVVCGGLLYAAAFLLPGGWALCWVALVPWAILYGRPGSRTSAWTSFPGVVVFACTVWSSLLKYGPFFVVTVSLNYFCFFAPALWLLRSSSRIFPRVPIAVRLAVLWTGAEFLLVRFDFYRAASFYLPNPLADFPLLVQASDVLGACALAFPVAFLNGLVADGVIALWRRQQGAGAAEAEAPSPRALRRSLVAAVAMPLALLAYGLARVDRSEPRPGPRIALVQPSLPHLIGWPLGVEIEEVYRTAVSVPPGSADLIVWPENSILDYYDRPMRYLDDLRWLARTRGAHVLFGAMGRAGGNPWRTTNDAILMSPEGRIEGSYSKIDIIPWAEYYPFESVLSRWSPQADLWQLRILLAFLTYFPTGTAGTTMALFPYEWNGAPEPFSVILCSEGTIAPRSREGVALGASFVFNLVSEGEAGPLLQRNMLRVCTLRAVENRRPFVRVGNTGITCTIDESGFLRDLLKGEKTGSAINEPGVLRTTVPLPAHPRRALYTMTGDLFGGACAAAGGAALLATLFRRKRRRAKPARAVAAAVVSVLLLAVAACTRAPTGRPEEFAPALDRGVKAFQDGKDNVALRALQRAASASPERPEPYRYIAEILRKRGQSFDGYRYFTERESLGAKNPEILGFLGYFQQAVYRKKEAVASLEASLTADPNQRACLLWLSALLHDGNRHAETVPYIRRFLDRHPADAEVKRLLAENLVLAGRATEAEPVLAELLRADSHDPDALRVKGLAELAAGRTDTARDFMNRAAASDPKTLETRYHQARIALAAGDLPAARAAIEALHALEKKGDFD